MEQVKARITKGDKERGSYVASPWLTFAVRWLPVVLEMKRHKCRAAAAVRAIISDCQSLALATSDAMKKKAIGSNFDGFRANHFQLWFAGAESYA